MDEQKFTIAGGKKNHLLGTQNFNLVATEKYTRSPSSINSNLTRKKRKKKKRTKYSSNSAKENVQVFKSKERNINLDVTGNEIMWQEYGKW